MELIDKAIKDSIRLGDAAIIEFVDILHAGVSLEDILNAVEDESDYHDEYTVADMFFGKKDGKSWGILVKHPATYV